MASSSSFLTSLTSLDSADVKVIYTFFLSLYLQSKGHGMLYDLYTSVAKVQRSIPTGYYFYYNTAPTLFFTFIIIAHYTGQYFTTSFDFLQTVSSVHLEWMGYFTFLSTCPEEMDNVDFDFNSIFGKCLSFTHIQTVTRACACTHNLFWFFKITWMSREYCCCYIVVPAFFFFFNVDSCWMFI